MSSFDAVCDDFGVSMYLSSKVELPGNRETVLHFFEGVRKSFPNMTEFEKRDGGEYALEEDREAGTYRWVTLDARRLCSGFVNPPAVEDADAQNERMLDLAQYYLGMTTLEADVLDVLYYFDLVYAGNHDEVAAEALGAGGPLEGLMKVGSAKVLHHQPAMMLALDDGCQLQARLTVETRTTAYHVRTGNFPESPLTVYFTVRQFWGKQPFKTFSESYKNQRRLLDELVTEHVVPNVVQPLARAIAAK